MPHIEEQLVGILFRTLEEKGNASARQELLEFYGSAASTARDDLAEDLFSQLLVVLHEELESEQEVHVLSTAVRSLTDRLAAIVETAPVAIFVVGADGLIQLWNDGATDIFGWEATEMRGHSYPDRLFTSEREFQTVVSTLRDGDRIHGMETRHRHRDGSLLDVRLWAAPFSGDDGDFAGATLVVSDITEQKQREQRLSVLNRVLRHNIRNEMTVIRNHLELLADEVGEDRHVEVIDERISNVIDLSDDARRIEHLEAGENGDIVPLDLGDLLRERVDRLCDRYPGADIRTSNLQQVEVLGHELLSYALDNVLENAVEHNDSDVPRVEVSLRLDENRAVVTIADNGPGLPDSERAVLTADEETPLSHGTGLGLWLTRWILRRSQGTVAVDSGPLGGTGIELVLRRSDRR